ncbi:MAG: ankyrin repeat domain-containing protein [Janthinobacterium lividum]
MSPVELPDLFQLIRLGVALDDLDERTLLLHLQDLNEYGQTLLHEAISYHQGEYALFLLGKGVNVQQADYQGATALHFAAYYRLADVAACILEHQGNPNAVDEHGNTPLWMAVFSARGEYQVVQLLVDAGADPTTKNKYGKSPMNFAQQINDEALQRILSAAR